MKLLTANSPSTLRKRVIDYFGSLAPSYAPQEEDLFGWAQIDSLYPKRQISQITDLLDYLSALTTDGDLYLFGGLLRDLALFGRRGFNSDIDVVVSGSWQKIYPVLLELSAQQNKFGGYRLKSGALEIDIWNAEDTWACRKGLVKYRDVSSLLDTTILNWDAMLMNWRTKHLIHKPDYFNCLAERKMAVVLTQNPNPLGAVVRVLRHILQKEAHYISYDTIAYLHNATQNFDYEEVSMYEKRSYGTCHIDNYVYETFRNNEAPIGSFTGNYSSVARNLSVRQLSHM